MKFFDLKTISSRRFYFYSYTHLNHRPYILFISMSAWNWSGSEQQDRRKDKEEVQEIWVKKPFTILRYSLLAVTLDCYYGLGYLYDHFA